VDELSVDKNTLDMGQKWKKRPGHSLTVSGAPECSDYPARQ